MGDFEAEALAFVESTLKYHPGSFDFLTQGHIILVRRQCLVGSLTGAVASQKVTEAYEGSLSLIGNQATSALA